MTLSTLAMPVIGKRVATITEQATEPTLITVGLYFKVINAAVPLSKLNTLFCSCHGLEPLTSLSYCCQKTAVNISHTFQ